ncbi:MAG TPA: diguanylate cyclase [Solirubrobacteraceae bacterium]|jgi:diguanylate cyclase (GGDEF)-like protein/PAS domain S-box-containing protein|nr:diguanylate cyclase [Solirubrobacteraceae bacterium]
MADPEADTAVFSAFDAQSIARGAEALLREHPDALICGLASNGLIVPVPQSVGLWGQGLIQGRALIDNVVAADRTRVVRVWNRAQVEGAAADKVRLLRHPDTWADLHFLDVREIHGVLLGVVIPSEEHADGETELAPAELAAPRFCALMEDEGARVIECDEAFTEMFGYSEAELIGESVLDQIHPEDQGRAVEGWLAVISTRQDQQTRLRRRRKDGSYVWVDTTLRNYLNTPERNCVLVEIIDASAEMKAQEELAEREEILRRLTNAMPVGLLHLDTERKVIYNNARLIDILFGSDSSSLDSPAADTPIEEPADDGLASSLLSTLTPEGLETFETALGEVLAEGVDKDVEVDITLPGGAWRRALVSLRALLRQSGEVGGAITCVLDITDSARARHELEMRATYDPLTSCMNRSSILAALTGELTREDAPKTGVVYVDLDKFKPVNDTLGHATGDELLMLVAERLQLASRDTDLVGRLGGDEFLIVLQDIPGADMAMRVAKRISEKLCGTFELAGHTIELRASIGVACCSGAAMTSEELVRRADEAMYLSKDEGQCAPILAGRTTRAAARQAPRKKRSPATAGS